MDKVKNFLKCSGEGKNVPELETVAEYKKRWRSIYVIYVTIFLMTTGFSTTLSSVWPYFAKVDPGAGRNFVGYIIAANPLAQMIAGPIVGYWANKIKQSRLPLICTMVLFAFASVLYAMISLFSSGHRWWMVVAKLLVGVSAANIAVCRSYLSAATMLEERTTAVSLSLLAQVAGFVVGSLIQAAATPLGNDGVKLGALDLDMYTVPSWINVLLAFLNILFLLPHVFQEHLIAAKEAMIYQGKHSEEAAWNSVKIDYISAITLIVSFFLLVVNFVILESLGVALSMHQFAMTNKDALKFISYLTAGAAVISCISYGVLGPLCKWFDERKILIWGGFFLMALGRFAYIPWGSEPPLINEDPKNETLLGCPVTYEWCSTTNAMTYAQLIIGFLFTAIAFPIASSLIQTILSKVLGPRPQGVWMGLFTGSGSLSRVVWPIFLTEVYTKLGIIWTFVITGILMLLTVAWLLVFQHKLKPVVESYEHKKDDFRTELDRELEKKWKQTDGL